MSKVLREMAAFGDVTGDEHLPGNKARIWKAKTP